MLINYKEETLLFRLVLQHLVYSSLMSWIPLQRPEEAVLGMLVSAIDFLNLLIMVVRNLISTPVFLFIFY